MSYAVNGIILNTMKLLAGDVMNNDITLHGIDGAFLTTVADNDIITTGFAPYNMMTAAPEN